MLILTYLLFFVALAVLLWVGTMWFQGYIYSEPSEQLFWRAPAAAAAITLFFAFWGVLAYRSPGDYPAMFMLPSWRDSRELPIKAVVYAEGKEVEVKPVPGQKTYVDARGQRLQTRPMAVIVEEDGERVRFDAEKDEKGYFKAGQSELLRYLDSRGRVMTEDGLGSLAVSRWGLFLGNVLLNLLHFGVWFVCCWLLLRYQWGHALGVAFVFWLIMTISVSEMIVQRVERAKKEQPKPEVSQTLRVDHEMCFRLVRCAA